MLHLLNMKVARTKEMSPFSGVLQNTDHPIHSLYQIPSYFVFQKFPTVYSLCHAVDAAKKASCSLSISCGVALCISVLFVFRHHGFILPVRSSTPACAFIGH